MKILYASVALCVSLICTSLQAAIYPPLLEAPALAEAISADPQLQIIDIRAPEDYAKGHIAHAVSAPYGQWRGPANNPGQLENDAYFQQLVRKLGLTQEQPIVVYSSGVDETDFGAAARVYWTLKYLGFSDLSILNGGLQQWEQPTTTQVSAVQSSQVSVQGNPKLVIFKDELLDKITQHDTRYQLLDARPPIFYQGQVKAPTASTSGTIATAQSLPFGQWFNNNDTRIRPVAQIKRLVQEQELDQAQETVSFCNTGHWAATNWFVLSELAELKDVRLYPASLTEWTQEKASLPMDNTPSRLEQIKSKFSQLVNK